MTYFWMGLLAGLAATPHCLGMCGAFPLHLARAAGPARLRHLCYLLGKTITYAFLGTLAGFAGHLLVRSHTFAASQDYLAYLGGGLLIAFGLALLGLLPRRLISGPAGGEWSFARPLFRHFLDSPGPGAALVLGALTGYLPCPITFALLTTAAATHSPLAGLVLLGGLGLGTAPALLGVGLSGALVARWRAVGLRGAGALLVVLGVITLLRPTGLLCRLLPVFPGIG